jgi:hypothetical protein
MSMIPSTATLSKNVVVSLFTEDRTGIDGSINCVCMNRTVYAASSDNDYSSLSKFITFVNGSSDGAEMCVSLTVNSDSLVEYEEYFVVHQSLVTSGASLSIGNNVSIVTIIDSDGVCSHASLLVLSAA